jgi:hypothetical protein
MTGKLPFFRSAMIYDFKGKIIINPNARTRDGVREGMSIIAFAEKSDPQTIGIKILEMLDKCIDGVPDNYERKPSPSLAMIVREAGLRSWSAFQKSALLITAYQKPGDNKIEFEPWRRVGGGAILTEGKSRISGLDPTEIGKTALETFTDAE